MNAHPDAPASAADRARPIAFLDRDGTINVDRHYIADPGKVELLPGAAEGLRRMAAAGYRLVIVTNQSGVGRGLVSAEAADAVTARLLAILEAESVRIELAVACPHAPQDGCRCRKPAPGLIERALHRIGGSLDGAVVVGDKASDIGLALAVGIPGVLVATEGAARPDHGQSATVHDLVEAADVMAAWRCKDQVG